MKTLILLLALWPWSALAKDKKADAKPSLDPSTQADVFHAQRDYSNFRMGLLPQELELQRRAAALQQKLQKAQEQCGDPKKWQLNFDTLECDEVKPAATPANPAPAPAAATPPAPVPNLPATPSTDQR